MQNPARNKGARSQRERFSSFGRRVAPAASGPASGGDRSRDRAPLTACGVLHWFCVQEL